MLYQVKINNIRWIIIAEDKEDAREKIKKIKEKQNDISNK